jgi:hypothetical protein
MLESQGLAQDEQAFFFWISTTQWSSSQFQPSERRIVMLVEGLIWNRSSPDVGALGTRSVM